MPQSKVEINQLGIAFWVSSLNMFRTYGKFPSVGGVGKIQKEVRTKTLENFTVFFLFLLLKRMFKVICYKSFVSA